MYTCAFSIWSFGVQYGTPEQGPRDQYLGIGP